MSIRSYDMKKIRVRDGRIQRDDKVVYVLKSHSPGHGMGVSHVEMVTVDNAAKAELIPPKHLRGKDVAVEIYVFRTVGGVDKLFTVGRKRIGKIDPA
jgi:hypothetical protein